jgi:hypothetical protein
MSGRLPPLEPLRRQPADTGTPAARLGDVVRAIPDPPGLADAARARIVRRLRDGGVEARRSWRLRPVLAFAVVLWLLALGIGAQAAVSWMRRPGGILAAEPRPAAAEALTPHHRSAPPREAPAIAAPRPEPAPPTPEPAVPAPAPARRARVEARTPVATREPEPSALAHESRLLARALAELRAKGNYASVLATLDEYDARFPTGVLRSEATLARLDALVAMGKSAAALALLDEATIRGPRALELLVLRGELRAAAGRHAEAIQDFDRVLARKPPAALERRALDGRARFPAPPPR